MLAQLTAIAEPTRFRIVELLRDGPRTAGSIGEALALGQPQASKHLRVLRDAGVVDVRAAGQQRVYALRPDTWKDLHGWLGGYQRIWEARFGAMDDVIAALAAEEERDARDDERDEGRAP